MKRQIINISDFNYIVDLYDANTDYTPVVYKKYYILRNISFIDNISYDTDIYFIEKDICEELVELVKQGQTVFDNVLFPCGNSSLGNFSKTFTDFSSLLTKHTFKYDTEGGNIFKLFNLTTKYKFKNINDEWVFISEEEEQNHEHANIKCDKIKIYYPHNKNDLKYVIYLDNIINGIHFHYLCKYNTECEYNVDTPFTISNKQYTEYVECYIPNIYNLFKEYKHIHQIKHIDDYTNIDDFISNNDCVIVSDIIDIDGIRTITVKDDNIYFNDYYNITKYINIDSHKYNSISNAVTTANNSWVSIKSENIKQIFDNDLIKDNVYKLSYVPFYLIINPFITYPEGGYYDKIFFKLGIYEANNYNALPLNITLYPYEFSETNNILLVHEKYIPNSDTFTHNYYFTLHSRIGFAHDKLCVINKFIYNNYNNYITGTPEECLAKAYADYNGLTEPIWAYEENGVIICESDETYDNNKKEFLISKEYILYKKTRDEIYLRNPNIDIENDYEDTTLIKCCGYVIEIFADHSFKNLIASEYIETPFIEDFDFSLINLFDNWYTIPETVIINIRFIDRYLGISIKSGYVILTKECIKYIFNLKNTTRLLKDMAWTSVNVNDKNAKPIYFIDKINCIVEKKQDTGIEYKQSMNTKIIYKPIFYRTQDLQNISIKNGLKQKIGINLATYMTKVNSFKLIIDDIEIPEYGRNDIYVIFELNAASLTTTSGVYSIVDSEENYLSSGNWYTV